MLKLLPLLLLSFTAAAQAQYYAYEGSITFGELSGKECGEVKAGDTRPYKFTVDIQGSRITGYQLIQGAEPGSVSGERQQQLTLVNADQEGAPDILEMQGMGEAKLSGEYRSGAQNAGNAGCVLLRARIEAQQSIRGQTAEAQQNELALAFQSAQKEYAVRKRDPQSYDEIVRLLPQLADTEKGGASEEALRLRAELQPLFGRTYGTESEESFTNMNARARMHEQLKQYEQALVLREQAHRLTRQRYPQWAAAAAFNLGDVLEKLGRKESALAAFAEATEIDQKQYGAEHTEVVTDLERQAGLLEAMQWQTQAIAVYQRILSIRENASDSKAEDIEQARDNLARARDPQAFARLEQLVSELGLARKSSNTKAAVELRQKMLPLAENTYGVSSCYLADLLETQADDLEALGRDQEAAALYAKAVPMVESCYGQEHVKTATALNNYGFLQKKMGRYLDALSSYRHALAIREKVRGLAHPDTASSLNNLASVYKVLGQYDQALSLYQRALAIHEQTYGLEHATTATNLNNLASVHEAQGRFDLALPLYQRALAIREKVLGKEHPDTAVSLNNLAELYRTLGQYDKALPLCQRALAIKEQALGEEHQSTAISLSNLALLYYAMGQYDQAQPLYLRALAIDEKVMGADHPDTATDLNGLGALYNALGQYGQALPLYQHALAIREKGYGAEHTDTATSLNNLAFVYGALGQRERALPLYQRALAIREKRLGPEHADTANSLNNLGTLHSELRQYEQALPLFLRALAIYQKALGDEHTITATSLINLGMFYGQQGRGGEALRWFKRSQIVTGRVIQNAFPVLSEKQKLQFVQEREGEFHAALSLIHRQLPSDAAAIRSALDLVLSRKGIVFDAQARQQEAIARSLDPETRKLWDALAVQRSQLAKQMQAGPGKLKPEEHQARLKVLQEEITRLEGQLASKSALVAQDLKQRTVTTKEVAQALGKDGALVEYAKIQDYDWDKGKWSDTWRYLAFILKGDGSIQMVDLGEAHTLETTVQAALKPLGLVGRDPEQQQAATRSLHQTLWQPISTAVGDASKIVFSPDGLLNLVPFAAMQDADGHYLIESRQISYVTSGRDLTKGDLGIKPETELYLAANPKFDLAVQVSPASASEELTRGAVRSAGFGLHFSPLPGTAREAEQIPGQLTGKQIVLTGKDATEDSVLTVRRPRVMHLSTHGFFLADQATISQGTRGASRLDSTQPPSPHSAPSPALPPDYENPLVRSGLAFAGANHASEAKDGRDGLLTALEVSGMDLHGTDLVTLSACETGRGEVKSGEGVFGLRRAFALAGTAHLMMSLWPVSDEVTAQQMQRFYQLYGKQTNPAAALRLAQLATIAELRGKKGQAEPALWAPFIVQGW